MSAFNGTWKFVESSNLRELFDEIGAFKELADAADQFKPIVILTVNDTELHMKITMFDREVERVYELGKEVDEVSLDGRNVRTLLTAESEKLTYKQIDGGNLEVCSTCEVHGDIMNTICSVGNVTANLKFERVCCGV
uniref:FABP domain-containing protein n=1 Tax=Trichobilharzia regenti TaxID=157069 RepID=A0AA85JY27_TRIRE|nr:unnamed protein product [Trichobilharzia regenti]